MDTLQSRLDAEFLLAHMCSVKFKEWIVVLATLLRRSEVQLDSFIQTLVSNKYMHLHYLGYMYWDQFSLHELGRTHKITFFVGQ